MREGGVRPSTIDSQPGRRVLAVVAEEFATSAPQILSARRDRGIILARQALCYILREKLNWTLGEIGHFVNRDHTTVLHAVRRARFWLHHDHYFTRCLVRAAARVEVP